MPCLCLGCIDRDATQEQCKLNAKWYHLSKLLQARILDMIKLPLLLLLCQTPSILEWTFKNHYINRQQVLQNKESSLLMLQCFFDIICLHIHVFLCKPCRNIKFLSIRTTPRMALPYKNQERNMQDK